MLDPQCFMDDFDHGRETVRGARRGGNDAVNFGAISIVIHAIDDVGCWPIFDRRTDHHLFHTRIEIGLQRGLGLENASAVNNHIDPVERQFRKAGCSNERQSFSVNSHAAVIKGMLSVPSAMNSIEFKKVRMHGGITDGIVDPRNLCPPLQQRLEG